MSRIEQALKAGVEGGRTPGVVGIAATTGGTLYAGAHGVRKASGPAPMALDSVFRIFSMTKAIGTAAAMILVDRGEITLDTPVADILPAFAEVPVLEGFDGDTPRLRPARTRATVRHLATHTSGLVYEFWNANQQRYLDVTGRPSILSGEREALMSYPLAFDPGERWDYGVSIDWLGALVEAVAGERIDAFCQREIFDPLGMQDTAFELRPDMVDRLVGVHAASPEGFVAIDLAPPPRPELYGMGHCLYSTGPDYMKFLMMLLGGGAPVFRPGTVDEIARNQIGDLEVGDLVSIAPQISADVALFPGIRKTFGLGFLRNEADVPEMRSAGSQTWAGVLNTHFWWDPVKRVAAVIMMQHLPFVDENAVSLYGDFERAVYASL